MCSFLDRHNEYKRGALSEDDVSADPVEQFAAWLAAAQQGGVPEPNAMTLATATCDGRPSARIVLLRGFDARGFVFYTNYESRKGHELGENPHAALVFYWQALERQVRITGAVDRVPDEETEEYFHGRPRGSQIGAWASRQSTVLGSRAKLEERVDELTRRYGEDDIPVPPYWGGYRLTPDTFEFWQGRPSRLHDRLQYTRRPDGRWRIERLSP